MPAEPWFGSVRIKRADDEIRTRDIHLGKVVLYQLSYVRMKYVPGRPDVQQQASFLALVGDTGIEPVTSSVSGKRATAAPIAHCIRHDRKPWFSPRWVRDSNPCIRLCRPLPRLSANPPCLGSPPKEQESGFRPILIRADDEIRTRDPHLGKVMRYHCATSASHTFPRT